MNVANASLETSKLNQQANSQPVIKPNQPNKADSGNQLNKADEPAKPRSLAEMFADPSDESSLEINLDDDTPDDPNAPIDSVERLKKRTKLTDEQVYAIKVPMPNGAEPLSIGELKDKIGDLVTHEMSVLEFDERRVRQEGELLKSQAELRDILAVLPKEALTPEVLNKLRTRQDSVTKREKQLTIEHIPSWRDESTRTKDIELMQSQLADYGFDESFLHSVVDHRAMKFIRDSCLMRDRIRKSIAQVRAAKIVSGKPSGKPNKAAVKPIANAPRKSVVETQDTKLARLFDPKE